MFALRNAYPRLSDDELIELAYGTPSSSRRKAKPKKRAAPKKKAARQKVDPNVVSYKQGRVIGLSVGGRNAYCPQYHGTRVSHAVALTEMGLDRQRASAVIDEMVGAGVLRHHPGIETTPKQKSVAREILYRVGGVQCKVKNNPRRRFSRRRRRF